VHRGFFVSVLVVGAALSALCEAGQVARALKVTFSPSLPYGIFYEDDVLSVKVRIENGSDAPVTVGKRCEVARVQGRVMGAFGAYAVPPEKVEDVTMAETVIPAKGAVELTIAPTTKRMGCFLVSVEVTDGKVTERLPLGTCIRIWKPVEGFRYDSYLIVPQFGWGIEKDNLWSVEALSRLGVKWIRATMRWPSVQAKEGEWNWAYCEEFMNLCRKHKMYVDGMAIHSALFALPKGAPVRRPNGGMDTTPMPDKLDAWREFFVQIARRYGDVMRAVEVWNEPWEGGGISEYGACGEHYRKMHMAAYEGVKSVDRRIVVGSNESEANCVDNLLCIPGFEKYFDVGYVHQYNTYQSYGTEFFAKLGKECWDNESWNLGTGVLDEPTALHLILFHYARGQRKVGPITGNDLFFQARPGRGPNPAAASFATLNNFLQDTRPECRINPTCAPWIWVFRGKTRAVAAVVGRSGLKGQSWDQQDRDGRMILDALGGKLSAFDRYGDPLPMADGKYTIPLTVSPYYVATKPKHLKELAKALESAVVEGIAPVQIAIPDFTAPLERKPPLRIRLQNAYNAPLAGKVTLDVPSAITLEKAALDFGPLGPGQTVELAFPITAATPLPENRYLVKCKVETGKGTVSLEEPISVAVLCAGTPQIDGDLGEWEKLGAIPVYLAAGKFSHDPALTNWFPFKKWKDEAASGYFGRFAALWDDRNLYFMAEVNDPTAVRHPGPIKGTWFRMMDPPCQYVYAEGPRFVFSADQVQIAIDCCPNADTLLPPDDPNYRDGSFRNTDYEFGLMDTEKDGSIVWRYLAPGLRWHHYYPFSPRLAFDQGIVSDARIVVKRDDAKALWVYEAAIPLAELKELKPEPGKVIRLSFRLNQDGESHVDWSSGRSTCKKNSFSFHPDWVIDYSVETEWGFAAR